MLQAPIVVAMLAAAPAAGGVVTEMTPDRIREAIAASPNAPDLVGRYRICADICYEGLTLIVTTPFRRVLESAWEAQKKYVPFTEKEVTPAMVAPTITVTLDAYMEGKSIRSRVVDIEHVVSVRPEADDNVDPATVVQPTAVTPKPRTWKSGMGVEREGKGLVATFPISVLEEGREFRVIMTGGAELAFPLEPAFLAKLR